LSGRVECLKAEGRASTVRVIVLAAWSIRRPLEAGERRTATGGGEVGGGWEPESGVPGG